MAAFARRAIDVAIADYESAALSSEGWVFFDRSVVDGASALQHASGEQVLASLGAAHRYHPLVFMAPPWPEIYRADAERRHDLGAAVQEYKQLLADHAALGYETVALPRRSVEARAGFVTAVLEARQ